MSERHVLELREDGWAIEHTEDCKAAGSLLDCIIHRRVARTFNEPDGDAVARNIGLGRWYVEAADLPDALTYDDVGGPE